ncbi:glycerol-3-phosphate acyltransferase [Patescibacteria group bacterium]|nr:glycerol-3-phosphate acyltransferase [Patescibacteria group bacterium]
MFEFLWIIFSYLLGSIPSGFLITRWSTKKNVLEIGWRKTSGSNVFKYVGKWQGALTGIFDLLKGYLAVFLARKLGLSIETQIFSGIAAICGHNWSLFIKFAGGRGVGTLIGAFLVISPKILSFSLIPFILLALIWNASIGTILFFPTAIFLSIYFNQFEIAGIFSILALFPILIKRLSPIKEIFQSKEKEILIRNRLIFDNDRTLLDLRIKKILRKFTK